jgi:dihydrofolate synthase/folylpolyglutamate synthase
MTDIIPSQSSTLDDWLCYLESIHPANIDMGLTRVRQVGQTLGYTQLNNVILIAGTNGKGTTARCLEALLLAQGYTVGTYASPHLIRYNERVRINGKELADTAHVSAFDALERGRGDITLTYFESHLGGT